MYTLGLYSFYFTAQTFKNTPKLNSFFKMLSTNKDRNGLEFVSTVEAIKYPFYAVQWHPEKNTFEWNLNEVIHHSFHAVRIAQTVANFFVNEGTAIFQGACVT